MELAWAIGSLKLDAGAVLALVKVNVVNAAKEPREETELEGTLGEVLKIEEMVEELLEFEDRVYAENDAVDETLRFEEELAGGGCCCGCGCSCGYGCICLGVPLMLVVGTASDV